MIQLLDVSGNQPEVNWPAVVTAGMDAVMVKGAEGVNFEDPCCRMHCDGVRSNQLKLGVYLYVRIRHGHAQDVREQVRQYLGVWMRESCDLKPMLDVERGENELATPSEWADAVTQAVDEVEQEVQVSPILYTSRGEWESNGLGALTSMARCPLWLAAYVSVPICPRPWPSYAAWQFTGSGKLPGVLPGDGPLDLSRAPDLSPLLMAA
jgi:lysozyme